MSLRGPKLLKKFYTEKSPGSKKIKQLLTFTFDPKEDVEAFYKENSDQVWLVINDRINEIDLAPKQKKSEKSYIAELQPVLQLLGAFIDRCLVVKYSTYQKELVALLRRCLAYQNTHGVRMETLEVLLKIVDMLHLNKNRITADNPLKPFLELLADAINLAPVLPSGKGFSSPCTPPSEKETVETWSKLLVFINTKTQDADFNVWFDLLLNMYFPKFYPICTKLDFSTEKTLVNAPPPAIHEVTVTHICDWIESGPNVNKVLWEEKRQQFMLDIFRNSCQAPVSLMSSTTRIIDTYRNLLVVMSKAKVFGSVLGGTDNVEQLWMDYISILSDVFLVKSEGAVEQHAKLCNTAIEMYNLFGMDLGDSIAKSVWFKLQETILDATCKMMASGDPRDLKHISTHMAEKMFGRLFVFWIRSPYTTEEMWVEFSDQLMKLTEWKEMLNHWREKIRNLTLVLKDVLYGKKIAARRAQFAKPLKKARPGQKKDVNQAAEWESDNVTQLVQILTISNLSQQAKAAKVNDASNPAVNFNMKWTENKIKFTWFTLLHILGNINSITNPENYTTAVEAVTEVIDILTGAENELDLNEPPIIPVFQIFLPWLVEACCVEGKRNRGRLVAYTTICKLFCRPHIPEVMDLNLLSHFYNVIQSGLASGHSSIVWTIVRNTANIFALSLPGVYVLVPSYLREIRKMFEKDTSAKPPAKDQSKAIQILSCLICVPTHFKDMAIPHLDATPSISKFSLADTKEIVVIILLMIAGGEGIKPVIKCQALCCLVLRVMDDLVEGTGDKKQLDDIIKMFLVSVSRGPPEVAQCALTNLAALTELYPQLTAVNALWVSDICIHLGKLIADTIKPLRGAMPSNEDVLVEAYYTMMEFILVGGVELLKSPDLFKVAFAAVQLGVLGDCKPPVEAVDPKICDPKERRKTKMMRHHTSSSSSSTPEPGADSTATVVKHLYNIKGDGHPTHGSEKVKEAAETVLHNLFVRFNNYPCPDPVGEGIPNPDEDDQDTQFFVFQDSVIFALRDMHTDSDDVNDRPFENGPKSWTRLTVRDCTGKYSWDFCLQDDADRAKSLMVEPVQPPKNVRKAYRSSVMEPSSSDTPGSVRRKQQQQSQPAEPYKRDSTSPPIFNDKFNFVDVDMLDHLIDYCVESDPMLVGSEQRFLSSVPNDIKKLTARIDTLVEDEDECEPFPAKRLPLFPGPPPSPHSNFQYSRMLLSQLGFLKDMGDSFKFLAPGPRMKRSLKELDKINGREVIKVGMIFIDRGQEDQESILKNAKGTSKYIDFIDALAWSVLIDQHSGYKGGLDSRSTGSSAPYYASPLLELVFHDITRMPTTQDPQQIHKKRHVGNDNIHVCWSEHKRDYDPSTITSQFNDAHIVIYPLSTGLYRVQLFKKEKVGHFGPIQDGMVVSKHLLPIFVRQTCINANTAVRALAEVYKKPFPTRLSYIKETITRYQDERAFQSFMNMLFLMPGLLPPPKGGRASTASPASQQMESANKRKSSQDDVGDDSNSGSSSSSSSSTSSTGGSGGGGSVPIRASRDPTRPSIGANKNASPEKK